MLKRIEPLPQCRGRFRFGCFRFFTTLGMDSTNDIAEQAIRFIVIDRHLTQGTRSAKGRAAHERLWTVTGTCALQRQSA